MTFDVRRALKPIYKVRQFKNKTGAKIWLIHRILQYNSYPLQCTPLPYLHTAAFVSSIVQSSAIAHQPPGCSVAVPCFVFTSSSDGKWVPFSTLLNLVYRKKSQGAKSANMEYVQVFECVYWEDISRAKGRFEPWHCSDAASSFCSFRDSAVSSAKFVAPYLLIPRMSAIILTLRLPSWQTVSLIFWSFWSLFELEGWPGC